jgi:anaerobic magnesium-protoporphyrin IX monomethyl ester cyclase
LRVLLIQAYVGSRGGLPSFPLGLAYLVGALKEHECTVIDPNTVEKPFSEIERAIDKTNPDVIGISLRNIDTAQSFSSFTFFDSFVSMLKFIKKIRPNVKIVVGGTGFSIFAKEIMELLREIDFGLFLEGEYSFPDLLRNLHNPERVKGIYFRNNEKIFFTGRSESVDFSHLEPPPREFPNLNLSWYRKSAYSIGVQTKRGCAFNCAYCTYPYLQGSNVRLRSPRNVVNEIENLVNLHDIREVFFADTIFNFPMDQARNICRELLRRKLPIKWRAWFREDFVNETFMIEARDSGCECFEFSPDGGSQDVLDKLQKGITIKDIKRTSELARRIQGIRLRYNFAWNVPGENLRNAASLYKLLSWIVAKNWKQLECIGLSNIRIYPHTKIYQVALKEGYIRDEKDLLFPTFYDPFPSRVAYFPAKFAQLKQMKMRRILHFKIY